MSGGHFDYNQYRIREISDKVEHLIDTNNICGPEQFQARNFSDATITQFRAAYFMLRVAEIYVDRIDYLVSGDDSEESFDKQLSKDIEKLNEETAKV